MSDDQPFLIAHKVRGEPAFDIAIQMEVDGYDEPWWIIPTSGHRAYPYWHHELEKLMYIPQVVWETEITYAAIIKRLPQDWPDHYQCDIDAETLRSITVADVAKATNLLQTLGLIKPKVPMKRRV